MLRSKIFLLLMLWGLQACAQTEITDQQKKYDFIKYAENELYMPDSANMKSFFGKLAHLVAVGDKQINIVQIGDSHIQADLFSNRLRQMLQSYFIGGNGGRGFVFPYTMARTNNPSNYKVKYTGSWTGCRNIELNKSCTLGLAGIAVTTYDSVASFSLSSANFDDIIYDYTRIRIFYDSENDAHNIELENIGSVQVAEINESPGVKEWILSGATNEVDIRIRKTGGGKEAFTLYGVALETEDPGIIYHSVGVNGAQVTSFLRCELLDEQLQKLDPDLIVISLGTNDAYGSPFDESVFQANYLEFLNRIKKANPGVPILLTTPGDCYKAKHPNTNNIKAREAIYTLAKTENCNVWDFFTVMGGLSSMQSWRNNGLAGGDRVHLTKAGYELQGSLMFDALVKGFENYVGSIGQK
jgi:lysophospholipase L1-like esterase